MNKSNKLLLLLASALLLPASLRAVPAYPAKRTMKLADGTVQTLTLTGDEHCHYWLTDDGRRMALRADGSFRPLSYFEMENMKAAGNEARQGSNARRARRKALGNFQPILGKKRGLVILVNFRDVKFTHEDPQAVYQDFFNKRGYTEYGMTGSVSDYFIAQSYGKFELDFDVVGPYTLTKAMGAYGAPSEYGGHDSDPGAMVEEACKMADDDVYFRNYDWDEDGQVDQVYVIYAGYGENYGAPANTIWPHESVLYSELTLDYVKISTYACSCELSGTSGTDLDGIGTACHEFSHCLGLPDFYDTSTSGNNFAMSYWDLMSAGSYNNDSRTPAGYTAYERWVSGWLEPTELTEETKVKGMKPLVEAPEAYILYNEANRNEFYLLENRQPVGFDAGLYGHGMLVVHVDYDKDMWASNNVNTDASHQRMTIIAADGSYQNSRTSLEGDPFPGSKGKTALTDDSSPAATLYNKNVSGEKRMGKAIERITESEDGLISFLALRPPLGIPQVSLTPEGPASFTVSWGAVDKATEYEMELTETPARQSAAEARTLEEDFQGAYSKTAGFSDVSSKLNTLLSTKGFSGSGLYQTPDLLRLGTGTTTGQLRTPTQNALSTGQLTVVMKVKPFTEGTSVTASVSIRTNNKPLETINVNFDTERYVVLHPTTVLDEIFRVEISASSRMYIQYLALYDGVFSVEELGLGTSEAKPRRVVKQTLTTTGTSYTWSDLTPGSLYTLIVRAKDAERASRWSQEVSFQAAVGIDAVSAQPAKGRPDVWYDLQGRPVSVPQKHNIYIRNGRKVLF